MNAIWVEEHWDCDHEEDHVDQQVSGDAPNDGADENDADGPLKDHLILRSSF